METDVVPRMESYLESLYDATFDGWRGNSDSGYTSGFDKPEVYISSKLKVSPSGIITVTIHSKAVDSGGQSHLLYFWLDFGTSDYQHTRRSRAFPVRSRKRWKSGKGLRRGPALSNSEIYTGEWRHIPAGRVRRGITESGITSIIATEFKREVRNKIYPVIYKGFRRIDLSGKAR